MECANCGNTLYIGQRFCRACGAPSGQYNEENLPTQMMPDGAGEEPAKGDSWPLGSQAQPGWQGNTSPAGRPNTTPVYPGQPYYTPQSQPQYPAAYQQKSGGRSGWGWILAFIGIFLFGAIFLGVLMIARTFRGNTPRPTRIMTTTPAVAAAGETVLSDDDAVIGGDTTTYSQTYPLDSDGSFSLTNLSGPVTIEGWDTEDKAEVQIVKRGGNTRDRKNTQIFVANDAMTPDANRLSLRVGGPVSSRVDVEFIVKLPKDIKTVTISSSNSSLKVKGVNGKVTLATSNGSIEVAGDITEADVRTTNGSIKATVSGDGVEGPLSFQTVNGSVSLEMGPDFNAMLDAVADLGSVNVTGELPLTIEKRIVGQKASGKIGDGGEPLTIRTKTGSIKLTKQIVE
ncbi:MAG: hypothetical protein DMF61_05315 [Blastocatellia bacterium AA13]|nr:MAG: hypothetical protein DMF61_05315 [Blastocatellia bacterium AA13]